MAFIDMIYIFLYVMIGGMGFISAIVIKKIILCPLKVVLHRGNKEIYSNASVVKVKGRGTWLKIVRDHGAVFPFPPNDYWSRCGRWKDIVHVISEEPGSYIPFKIQLPKIRVLTTDDRELMYSMEENVIQQLEKKSIDWNQVVTKALPIMIAFVLIIGLYFTYDKGLPAITDTVTGSIKAQAESSQLLMDKWRASVESIQTNLSNLNINCNC